MLPVPITILDAVADMVVQPLRGVAFSGSRCVGPAAPGVHLAACGRLGCPLIAVGWGCSCRDNHYDDSHPPYRTPRNDGSYRCGDSRPLGNSRNRDGCRRRGSIRPPNRGCHLYICRGDRVSQSLLELVE